MNIKLIKNKELLFDGAENQELHTIAFKITKDSFKLSEISKNKFEGLKNYILEEDFLIIIKQCRFQTNENSDFQKYFKDFDFGEYYKSEENLEVYYFIKNDILYVFSFGEKQPARYMLYLEGIWNF